MISDVFSVFDYGGSVLSEVSWLLTGVLVLGGWLSLDMWVLSSRLSSVVKFTSVVLGFEVGVGGWYGYSFFCSGLGWCLLSLGVSGVFPYGSCSLSSLCVSLGLSGVLWVSLVAAGFVGRGFYYVGCHVPDGLHWFLGFVVGVFELVSIFVRAFTLGARFSINLVAGKVLIGVGAGFLGCGVLSYGWVGLGWWCLFVFMGFITLWEFMVVVIQCVIFVFLFIQYGEESKW